MASSATPTLPVSPVARAFAAAPPPPPATNTRTQADHNSTPAPVELDGSPITPGGHHRQQAGLHPSAAAAAMPAEERARAHAAKEGDPAVLVDIPKSPAPQDYEVAELTREQRDG
ncbi:MAG: hypothetical protein M1826_007658 [Phylliscum demangeonii]|nr:MAG: hypothetical protein M1826_007658 [Phylliscum demangeonii]